MRYLSSKLYIQSQFLLHRMVLILLFILPLFLFGQESGSKSSNKTKSRVNEKIVDSGKLQNGVVYQKVVVDGYSTRIPFYLFTTGDSDNYVMLLHGLGGSKMDWIYPSEPYLDYTRNLNQIRDSLLAMNYNIVIPDAKFHGERTHELDFRPIHKIPPLNNKPPEDGELFSVMMQESVNDFQLIMDYLENRNEVSEFQIIGYSMGGAIALILNSTDDRVSSVAACVPPLNHPAKEITSNNWPDQLKAELSYYSSFNHAAGQTAPVALFMGKEDFFYTPEEVEQFFKKIPTEKKQLKYYNSGHELPDEFVNDVLAWMLSNRQIKKMP